MHIAGVKVNDVIFGEINNEVRGNWISQPQRFCFYVLFVAQEVQPVKPPIAGLVGLAYKSIAQDAVDPLVDQMYQNGQLAIDGFGLYLRSVSLCACQRWHRQRALMLFEQPAHIGCRSRPIDARRC